MYDGYNIVSGRNQTPGKFKYCIEFMDISIYSTNIKIQWGYLTQNSAKCCPLTRWPGEGVLSWRDTFI